MFELVEDEGVELFNLNLILLVEDAFLSLCINNLADDGVHILGVNYLGELALHHIRKLVYNRSVDDFTFDLVIVLPLLKDNTSKYLTNAEYDELSKRISVKFSGETGIVTLSLDGINYIGIIKKNLTFILDGIKKNFPDIVVWDILDILAKDTQTVLDGIFNPISDEKMEAIIKLLVKTYETELCKLITGVLIKEDFALKAGSLAVES